MRGPAGLLQRGWEGERGWAVACVRAAATPLSWLWAAGTRWRTARAARRPAWRPAVGSVVSVGNLAVGGTGKTPLTAWIVRELVRAGAQPGIVLSGYGADEVLLHRRWHPAVPVAASKARRHAVERAVAGGARVIVLDDGFQHRAVARDLDIVLLAAEHRFPDDLLPKGPYREGPGALARADIIVVTRRTAGPDVARARAEAVGRYAPGVPVAGAWLRPGRWLTLAGDEAAPPAGPILAAAAIARPHTFAAALRSALPEGTDIALRGFGDHHAYSDEDVELLLAEAEGRTLVVTEKDAVKLAGHPRLPDTVRVLASEVVWDFGETAVVEALGRLGNRGGM